jgi:hypothetical protein
MTGDEIVHTDTTRITTDATARLQANSLAEHLIKNTPSFKLEDYPCSHLPASQGDQQTSSATGHGRTTSCPGDHHRVATA